MTFSTVEKNGSCWSGCILYLKYIWKKSILYFVFSDQLQKYLIQIFQIHFFKSILYFVFEQRKSIFYNTAFHLLEIYLDYRFGN